VLLGDQALGGGGGGVGGLGADFGDGAALGGGDLVLGHAGAALDQRGGVGLRLLDDRSASWRARSSMACASAPAAADLASYSARSASASARSWAASSSCSRMPAIFLSSARPIAAGTFFQSMIAITTSIASATQAVALRPSAVGLACGASPWPPSAAVSDEEQDHRDDERQQAEKLGGGEADEQTALLAVGGGRVAQRALEERAEDVAHAERGHADADGGETGTEQLCGFCVHVQNSFGKTLKR
jgi:hypothetical protein